MSQQAQRNSKNSSLKSFELDQKHAKKKIGSVSQKIMPSLVNRFIQREDADNSSSRVSILKKIEDQITPTPDIDFNKIPVQNSIQKVSRFLPLPVTIIPIKEIIDSQQELDISNNSIESINVGRLNNYNIARYLLKDDSHKDDKNKSQLKKVYKLRKEINRVKLEKNTETLYIHQKTKINSDNTQLIIEQNIMNLDAQKLLNENVKFFYQFVAFNLQQTDDIFYEKINEPGEMNFSKQKINFSNTVNLMEKEQLQKQSNQPFIQPINNEKIPFQISSEFNQVKVFKQQFLPKDDYIDDDLDIEERAFAEPARISWVLNNNKERFSQIFKGENTILHSDELAEYNEAIISKVSKNILNQPPILQQYLKIDLLKITLYKDTNGETEKIFLNLKEIGYSIKILEVIQNLYNMVFDKFKKLETIIKYLFDNLYTCQANQQKFQELSNNFQKEKAKLSIIETKEFLKKINLDDLFLPLNNLQKQMGENQTKINYLIGLTDQEIKESLKIIDNNSTDSINKRIIQQKQHFTNFLIEIENKFKNYINDQTFVYKLQKYLQNFKKQQNQYNESDEAALINFIMIIPQKVYNSHQDIINLVTQFHILFLKLSDKQQDDLNQIRQFISNFSISFNQLLILYDFSQIKINKLQIKKKLIINQLDMFKLPYENHSENNIRIFNLNQKSLQKIQTKLKICINQLVEITIFNEFVQQIQTSEGRLIILDEFIDYRNQIIKNPRKFNYNKLILRPMFFLQKIKEIFLVEKQINLMNVQFDIIQHIFIFFHHKVPVIENALLKNQNLIKIHRKNTVSRNLSFKSLIENMEDFVYKINKQSILSKINQTLIELKGEFLYLNQFDQQDIFYLDQKLPYQIVRLNHWIIAEIDQINSMTQIIMEQIRFIPQDQNGENGGELDFVIKGSIKIENTIGNIICYEPSIEIIKIIGSQELKKNKEKLKYISDEQQLAIYDIYLHYVQEFDPNNLEVKILKNQKITIHQTLDKYMEQISVFRESVLSIESKKELTQIYQRLNEAKEKFLIWEHISACRYLMNIHLLRTVIKQQQILAADKLSHEKIIPLNSMISQLQSHTFFFSMNQLNQQSQIFKKYCCDGLELLNIIKSNFTLFKQMVLENKLESGKHNIDNFMQEFKSKLGIFIHQKQSLNTMKVELIEEVKTYVEQNTVQSKNIERSVELDRIFQEFQQYELEIEDNLKQGLSLLRLLYETDYMTQRVIEIKNDPSSTLTAQQKQKSAQQVKPFPSLDEFQNSFSSLKLVLYIDSQAQYFLDLFHKFQKYLQNSGLPEYENKLKQKIEFQQLVISYKNLFTQLVVQVHTNTSILNNQLEDLISKYISFFNTKTTKSLNEQINITINQLETQHEILLQHEKICKFDKLNVEQAMIFQIELRDSCYYSNNITNECIKILKKLFQITDKYQQIQGGFVKNFDKIEITDPDFFKYVQDWIIFFHEKDEIGVQVKPELQFNNISEKIFEHIRNIPESAKKIKDNLTELCNGIYGIILEYFNGFQINFMLQLSAFGQEFYSGDEKVQNFLQFSKDLLFGLTIRDQQKETVRNALDQLNKKLQKTKQPLQRMNQFYNAVIQIQGSKEMKLQKRLNQISNINSIYQNMGEDLLEAWVKVCQNMQNTLQQYFQDAQKGELKIKANYIVQIEESRLNLSSNAQSLKEFIDKFLALFHKDYDLSYIEID